MAVTNLHVKTKQAIYVTCQITNLVIKNMKYR